jgi:hypothetical protein
MDAQRVAAGMLDDVPVTEINAKQIRIGASWQALEFVFGVPTLRAGRIAESFAPCASRDPTPEPVLDSSEGNARAVRDFGVGISCRCQVLHHHELLDGTCHMSEHTFDHGRHESSAASG